MTPDFYAQVLASGLVMGAIYSLIAIGYNIVFSATSGVSFAQGEYVTLAGFTAIGLVGAGIALPLAVLAAIAAATLVSAIFERTTIHPVLMRGPVAIGMVTIGQQIALQTTDLSVWGYGSQSLDPFTGGEPVRIFGAVVLPQAFWVVGVTFLLFIALRVFYAKTWLGRSMQACSEDKEAAASLGINPGLVVLAAFVLSGAAGAIAGVLVAPIVAVYFQSGIEWALKGMAAAIIGGLGNTTGSLVGGFSLGVVEALSSSFIPAGLQSTVPLTLLVLLLMFRPSGLLGRKMARL